MRNSLHLFWLVRRAAIVRARLEVPGRGLRLLTSKVSARQKIRTNHLQTIAPRLIGSEHEGRYFDGLLDDVSWLLKSLK